MKGSQSNKNSGEKYQSPLPTHFWYIQNHTALIVAGLADLRIAFYSQNAPAFFSQEESSLPGRRLSELLPPALFDQIRDDLVVREMLNSPPFPLKMPDGRIFQLLSYRYGEFLLLEVEPAEDGHSGEELLRRFDRALQHLDTVRDLPHLLEMVVDKVKALTGYQRVLVLRLEEERHGEVVAEAVQPGIPIYLGLRFPGAIFPAPIRELYLVNQVRSLADTEAHQAILLSAPGSPAEPPFSSEIATHGGIRPEQQTYLHSIAVQAGMSVAIVHDRKLWGLIACYHHEPKFVDARLRHLLTFIGKIIAGYLALISARNDRVNRLHIEAICGALFSQMSSSGGLVEGLTQGNTTLMHLVECCGAAVLSNQQVQLLGKTPTEDQVQELTRWLDTHSENGLFHSSQLPLDYAPARQFPWPFGGMLALAIATDPASYLLWFRLELTSEPSWKEGWGVSVQSGKDPLNPVGEIYEAWKKAAMGTAAPWRPHEIQATTALHHAIKDFLLEEFAETRRLNKELARAYREMESFSYSVSHDLRAPLRSIEGFAQILMEDYQNQLDDYGKTVIQTIVDSVGRMNVFINHLLTLSRLSSQKRPLINPLSLEQIARDRWALLLATEAPGRQVQLHIAEGLPSLPGDETMIIQLVENLLSNALKYTRPKEQALVEIGGQLLERSVRFFVRDNGIGFDMRHEDRIFELFRRLVTETDFEGTGVGLAIAKRVVERHGGHIWVESSPGQGATFFFELPQAFTDRNT